MGSMKVRGKKVFVGLSGGVDSAVSAALLKQQGYNVTGVFAWIALPGYPCSAGGDRREALRVATHLQIPFEDINLSEEYRKKVFESALESYRRGETPNPDALCNREIKFGLLYDFVRAKGADHIATGHYARTKQSSGGETHLYAGVDSEKDQSYFLWAVPESILAHALFPVGGLHKREVRVLARKFGLPNAQRKDSQGLCFLGNVSMEEALLKELRPAEGTVLDRGGTIIGKHRGAVLYTIGQRHGFELFVHGTKEVPHYVVAKNIEKNTITVSSDPIVLFKGGPSGTKIELREMNWIGTVENGACQARFSYRQHLRPAWLTRRDITASVEFGAPEAVPVGQSLVLYRGARCLGGGVIDIVK